MADLSERLDRIDIKLDNLREATAPLARIEERKRLFEDVFKNNL